MTLLIPARARAYIYGVFGLVSLAVGAAQVGYAAVPADAPTWLTVALAVVPFVGAGIGYTAATHTTTTSQTPDAPVVNLADRRPGPDHRADPA